MPAIRHHEFALNPAMAIKPLKVAKLSMVVALLWNTIPANAETFCSEPVAPYCTTSTEPLSDSLQYKRCEEDFARYEEKIMEYEMCLATKLDALKDKLKRHKSELEERRNAIQP